VSHEDEEDLDLVGVADVSGASKGLKSPKVLAKLLPLLRPYRWKLALASVCLLVAAAVNLAFPLVVGDLLDAAFVNRDRGALNRIAIGLLALFALQGAMTFVQVYLLTSSAERVIAALRTEVFARIVRLSPAYFTEKRSGELTSHLASDVNQLQALLTTWVSELLRHTIFLIGGLTLLVVTQPALTLITLPIVPLVIGVAILFGARLRIASGKVQERIGEAMAGATEAFTQIRTVQAFHREASETRRFDEQLRAVVDASITRAWARAAFFGIVGFIAFAGVVAILWRGGALVLDGRLSAGSLVSFMLIAVSVAAAVGMMAAMFTTYQEAVGAAERVFAILGQEPTVAEAARPTPLSRPPRGQVAFEGVGFRYGPELPTVLTDISFTIAPGEVVALVGPSGAGKSTVASLLLRFWDVQSGRVTIDSVDLRQLSFADLRGAVGMVPQDPALFSGTVRENIAYAVLGDAPSLATEAAIVDAARAAHALEFIERLPQGFDTRVGERGIKLSGGQRQRIAIARVFLRNPAVVILDEATSSLDNESERLISAAMEDLLRGRSTLIIAHRLSTVRRADRVLVLDGGAIVEQGKHDELIALDGVYARLYRAGRELIDAA
jgi:subfamily B ATP-binding cassette protein MsbA